VPAVLVWRPRSVCWGPSGARAIETAFASRLWRQMALSTPSRLEEAARRDRAGVAGTAFQTQAMAERTMDSRPWLTSPRRSFFFSFPSSFVLPMSFTLGIDYGTNSVRRSSCVAPTARNSEPASWITRPTAGHPARSTDHTSRALSIRRLSPWPRESGERCAAAARKQRGFDAGEDRRPRRGYHRFGVNPVDRKQPAACAGQEMAQKPRCAVLALEDHTGWRDAARITELAAQTPPALHREVRQHLLFRMVGSRSWHCSPSTRPVFDAAYSWVELSDWCPHSSHRAT